MLLIHTADFHIKLKQDKRYKRDLINILKFLVDITLEKKPDALIIAGDIFHTKLPTPTEYAVFTAFTHRITDKGIPIIIIPGNHDTPNNSEEAHTLKQFYNANIPNLHILNNPGIYTINGIDFLAMPYKHHDREATLREIKKIHDEYIGNNLIAIGHFWVDTYKLSGQDYAKNNNEFVVSEPYLRSLYKVKQFMLGHIHIGGPVFSNCHYSGSPFRITMGEKEENKYVISYNDTLSNPIDTIITPALPLKEILISAMDDLNVDITNIHNTICHLKVRNLDIDCVARVHDLKKRLEAQDNFIYTDLDLKTVKFHSVKNSTIATMSDYFDNYIKMNNLMTEGTKIKEIIQHIIDGNITDKTNFFDIKTLGLK